MRRLTFYTCLVFLIAPSLALADVPVTARAADDAPDAAPDTPATEAAVPEAAADEESAQDADAEDEPAADAPATDQPSADKPTSDDAPNDDDLETAAAAEAIALARAELDTLTANLLSDEAQPVDAEAAPLQLELAPPSLSSDVPETVPAAEPKPDLAWLEGIELPDIPVRWHTVLLDLLTYYRDDPRGRAHIRTWMQRAGAYEAMIRPKLREVGVPEDLMYVAMVESGYNPLVESSAGAVGMWQMVETTSRDYGLEKTRWVDARRAPERATVAAATYLKELRAKLGSWPLALAAYNMGYGAMLRSIRKYNSNDFWLLAGLEAGLPYETVGYVAKVMACAVVAHNLERFGLSDLKTDAPIVTAEVQAPGGTGLGRLASAAGISVDALSALNPELLHKRLPPDVKLWTLRIPSDKVDRFEQRFAAQKDPPRSHGVHVLRFGERTKDVAEMYGTTDRKLRALNDLTDDDIVRPGTRLTVPDVEPQPVVPSDEKIVVGIPEHAFEYPDRKHIFYAVQKDDDAASIAAFFQVTVDELQRWNDVSLDAFLQPGMTLQLFVPSSVDLEQAVYLPKERVQSLGVGSNDFFDYHEGLRDRTRIRYRVRPGDTLSSLAVRYDLSVGSIARINRFGRERSLSADSEIILYVPNKDVAKLDSKSRTSARD